jgi:hypothetical protein
MMLTRRQWSVLTVGILAALGAAVVLTTDAPAGSASTFGEPPVRDCSTDAYGDLGRNWRQSALHAGPVAFVGMRNGTRHVPAARPGRSWPLKILIVLEAKRAATVTIAARARSVASLAYDQAALRRVAADAGDHLPLSTGEPSVRFEACARPHVGERWNRGTQFPGYFLVSGRRCVDIIVRVEGRPGPLLRTLRFGRTRC